LNLSKLNLFKLNLIYTRGYENGVKCGIRSQRYNWNLRDKYNETREEWEAFKIKWDKEYKNNFERIALIPGDDETQLNFGWESITDIEPVIRISSREDMKNYKDFTGKTEYYREFYGMNYYSNQVTVTNLKPNSIYYYQRQLNGKWEDPVQFNTYDTNNFKFAFVGDPQIGGSNERLAYKSNLLMGGSDGMRNDAFNWNVTVNSFFKQTELMPSLLLSAGDQVDFVGDDLDLEQQYSAYLLPELMKSLPVAPTLGNHEKYSNSFRRHFNVPNPYIPNKLKDMSNDNIYPISSYNYFFKYNNVLVVVLESNRNSCLDCEMVISNAVNKYPEADWRIALFHHDLYGNGKTHSQGIEDSLRLRSCLTGLFDIYKFDLVINGHDHVHTTTKFISYNNKNNNDYNISNIQKNVKNENPKGTFFITANCSTGSKFLDFEEKSINYVFNYTQTFTSSFGTLEFENNDDKVKLTINFLEVDTHNLIDGPYIFEKDKGSNNKAQYDDSVNYHYIL